MIVKLLMEWVRYHEKPVEACINRRYVTIISEMRPRIYALNCSHAKLALSVNLSILNSILAEVVNLFLITFPKKKVWLIDLGLKLMN